MQIRVEFRNTFRECEIQIKTDDFARYCLDLHSGHSLGRAIAIANSGQIDTSTKVKSEAKR